MRGHRRRNVPAPHFVETGAPSLSAASKRPSIAHRTPAAHTVVCRSSLFPQVVSEAGLALIDVCLGIKEGRSKINSALLTK
jgi:hypothetical protein